MNIEGIKKAPHYFLVHFKERYAHLSDEEPTGKAHTIYCDGIATHVYGFKSDEEVEKFNPLELRKRMRGCKDTKILWDAENLKTLMQELENDPRVKSKVFVLDEEYPRGPIEDLPECERMYTTPDESLLCGKPQNEYGDGCYGGCVVQGNDQDEEFHDGFKCPIQIYWKESFEKLKVSV
jgi:hypothetical protein